MKTLTITTIVVGPEVDQWLEDRATQLPPKAIKHLKLRGVVTLQRTTNSQTTYEIKEV